jgi:hypothetical protein
MTNNPTFKSLLLSRLVYFSSIVLSLMFVAVFFSSLDIEGSNKDKPDTAAINNYYSLSSIYSFYDSDALFAIYFCKGTLKDGCFKYWNVGSDTNLFPSILIFMVLTYFIKSVLTIQLLFAFIQYLIFIILLNILFFTIFPKISLYALSIVNFMLILFLICPLYIRNIIINTNLFLPYHSGAFLNSILAIILMLKFINTNKNSYLIWFGMIVCLGYFSDSIFIIYFPVPFIMTMALFINSIKTNQIIKLICITIFSVFLGWFSYKTMVHFQLFYVSPTPDAPGNIKQSFSVAFNQFKSLIVVGGLRSFVFGLTFISILFSIILSIYFSIKQIIILCTKLPSEWNSYRFYSIFYGILVVGAIAAPIYRGIYFYDWNIRYCIFPIFLGLANVGFFMGYYLHSKKNLLKSSAIFAFALLFIFLSLIYNEYKPFSIFTKVNSYYPGIVKAVDDLSLKYPLKNGVGDHWDSKHLTVLSKNGVTVYTMFDNLYLWFHGNNKSLMFYKDCNMTDTAFFNFVVLRMTKDTTYICNFFGDKIKRVTIDGYKFYLVPDFYYERSTGAPTLTNRNVFFNTR